MKISILLPVTPIALYKNFSALLRYVSLNLLMVVTVISCHSPVISYQGMQIPEEKQIRLIEGEEHHGTWRTEDITIDYSYAKINNMLKISGSIVFSDALKNSFNYFEYFSLWLNLIDTGNKISGNTRIDQRVSSYPIERAKFNADIELPPGVKAIVFSYEGRAIGDRDWPFDG